MSQAPNRGQRKCGTCALYTSKEEEWNKDCRLDRCECKIQGKEFGRALCKNYKGKTYIDTSNLRGLGGPPTGLCEWKCPPMLRDVLYREFDKRYVNKDASWCHCWEPTVRGPTIENVNMITQEGEEREQNPMRRLR